MTVYEWDVFVSHASEDKESVARPLSNHLAGYGLKVWIDASELHLGDSLRAKIDAGLAKSRFGIVILSPSFFEKTWTRSELDGLVARENDGVKVILPIWHDLSLNEIRERSPVLAGRLAASTAEGLPSIAARIVRAIEDLDPIKRSSLLVEGRITKKKFLNLPDGSFLLSNLVKHDLTPAFADTIPPAHLRERLWKELSLTDVTKSKFYVFQDDASYRAHMAQRNLYVPEGANRVRNSRRERKITPDFDPELVRAYIAAAIPLPTSWRSRVTSLSFEDEKYKFENLDGLLGLTKLERLDLFDIDPVSLDPLRGLKNLRWLYLSGNSAPNIDSLSNLTKLEHLDLNLGGIDDLGPLRTLTNLRYLNVWCQNVTDVSCLRGLTQLRFLSLGRTPTSDASVFGAMTQLRTLDLWGTPIDDISALSNLESLQNLCLWKTRIRDISPLRQLQNLRTLDLDETNVEDVSELRELRGLRFLSVRNAKIRGLTELKKLPNLEIFTYSEPYTGNAKIDPSEDWQIWYWTRQFSIDEDTLRSLITEHGTSAATIRRALS